MREEWLQLGSHSFLRSFHNLCLKRQLINSYKFRVESLEEASEFLEERCKSKF